MCLAKISEAFVPPKPKLLDSAARLWAARAVCGM